MREKYGANFMQFSQRRWSVNWSKTVSLKKIMNPESFFCWKVDLDLGNYERFMDIKLTRDNNITTGKIYQASFFL